MTLVSMNKFYTQTGDDGFTNLLGEGRVEKHHARIEAVGTIDEASAAIGFARRFSKDKKTDEILLRVQRDLYLMMSEIASTPENAERFRKIESKQIRQLEIFTDEISKLVELPSEFIIPGDSVAGAAISIARTVVRRAERRVAQLLHANEIDNPYLLRYLNRLSSLCFILELYENQMEDSKPPTLAKS
jgi:cob(I)alamin adenosyltransferase